MISVKRAISLPLSASASMAWTSSPSGWGSLASASMPSNWYTLAIRSQGYTGLSFTVSPLVSEAPTTRPPLKPPPATTDEKTRP